jgi:hypothetical protein
VAITTEVIVIIGIGKRYKYIKTYKSVHKQQYDRKPTHNPIRYKKEKRKKSAPLFSFSLFR